ncbi:outer membrane lipoprotein [Chitinasiproducens palmae]
MKGIRVTAVASLTATLLIMQGCSTMGGSPDVYTVSQAQREQTVRMATVESVRAVRIDTSNGGTSALGAIGGGAIGAVAGSAIGGGRGSLLTGIVGGIAGALAGNAVERGMETSNGLEITVRLDNGEVRAISQAAGGEVFQAGERVRLLSSGGITRVTH